MTSQRLREVAPQLDARQVSLMANAFVKAKGGRGRNEKRHKGPSAADSKLSYLKFLVEFF